MAGSPEDAQKRATDALAAIHCIVAPDEGYLYNLASFRELIDDGVSEDGELRIFEIAWGGPNISAWAEHPLFLTDAPTLLGKWAELYADLAREMLPVRSTGPEVDDRRSNTRYYLGDAGSIKRSTKSLFISANDRTACTHAEISKAVLVTHVPVHALDDDFAVEVAAAEQPVDVSGLTH